MRSRLRWSARGLTVAACCGVPALGGGIGHATGVLAATEAMDATSPLAAPVAVGAIGIGAVGMVVGVWRKRRNHAGEDGAEPAVDTDAQSTTPLRTAGVPAAAAPNAAQPTTPLRPVGREVPRPRAEPELPVRTPRSAAR